MCALRLRRTKCSQALDEDLLELRRRRERELLRPFLISEKCFPLNKNPSNAPITKDELKKLARAWKMQVWKSQLSTNDLISALVQYLDERGQNIHENSIETQQPILPQPPKSPRKSKAQSLVNTRTASVYLRDFYVYHKIVKNEINNETDLVIKSRFIQPPDGSDERKEHITVSVRDTWDDAEYKKATGAKLQEKVKKIAQTEDAVSQSKIEKHRAISRHLVLFSNEQSDRTINKQSLDAVFRLTDTEDKLTLLNCCIVISNFCSRQQLRGPILNMSVINKVLYFANYLKSSKSRLGIALTLYYLSLEESTQDIIFNSCQSILKGYCASTEQPLSSIALLTMSNLLTCTDRINLIHIMMELFQGEQGKILQYNIRTGSRETSKESSREEIHHMLATLMNMSTFQHCHRILFETGVFDMIDRLLSLFVARKSHKSEPGKYWDLPGYETDTQIIVTMMNTFLNSPDALTRVKNSEYVFGRIFLNLLKLNDNAQMILECIHAVGVFSGFPNLVKAVALSDLADAIFSYAESQELTQSLAHDLASYICNISKVGLMDAEVLCDKGALLMAVKVLMVGSPRSYEPAVSALLNLLTEDSNCEEHLDAVMQPISSLIASTNNVEAINCFYNLCCVPSCVARIAALKGHMWLVQYMRGDCNLKCKAAVLRVLVQLCRNVSVVNDLLAFGFMNMTVALVDLMDRTFHLDIIKFLVCVFLHQIAPNQSDLQMIIYILNKICSDDLVDFVIDEQVLSKCSIVLGYLSLCDCDFRNLERVLRLTLHVAATDMVRESISTALFNIISTPRNLEILLMDSFYLYTMITMMRSGSIAVQEKVSQVIRILCADPRCADIILEKGVVQEAGKAKTNLVADFIVIALLRTNSADIKVVIGQAIFNLLCHESYRLEFLRGDIWWAMIRLSKNDVAPLQELVVKTFNNLSTYPEYTKYVRSNAMFGFVTDMIASPLGSFTLSCMQSLLNIIGRCSNELTMSERCSLIAVCNEVLQRSDNFRECRKALQLLHKAAEICTPGQDLAEFLQIELLHRLEASSTIWLGDIACRRSVAQMLSLLSRFPGFESIVPLEQVETVMLILLKNDLEPSSNGGLLSSIDHEVSQCCMTVIIEYLQRDQSQAALVLAMQSWHCIVDHIFHEEDENLDQPMSTRLLVLAVFALCLHHNAGITEEVIKPDVILRIVLSDIDMTVHSTAVNAAVVIVHFSLSEKLAAVLLNYFAALFHFLNMTMVRSAKIGLLNQATKPRPPTDIIMTSPKAAGVGRKFSLGERVDPSTFQMDNSSGNLTIYEFCSTVLRNLSHHDSIRQKLVTCRGLDALFRNILASPQDIVYLDLMITLNNIIKCDLSSNTVVSPRFVLLQITSVLDTTRQGNRDPAIMQLTSNILSVVLAKYSKGIGYDARFIQSLISETNDGEQGGGDGSQLSSEDKDEFPSTLKELQVKPDCAMDGKREQYQLDTFPRLKDAWKVQVQSMQSKAMTMNVPFPGGTDQMSSSAVSLVEARPVVLYSKVVHSFPLIVFDANEEEDPEALESDMVPEVQLVSKEASAALKADKRRKISFKE